MIQSNNQLTSNSQALQPVAPVDSRKMVKAALLGQHSHLSVCGIEVHIWLRGTTYLARGRFQGKAFGETLGNNSEAASCKLRHLLVELDNGTFLRSSDRPKRQLRRGLPPKLDVRALCDAFLVEKRQVCGKDTAQKYRSRLLLLIEFAESIDTRRRWKLASDVDRNFVLEFRKFLNQQQVTRNGRAASEKKPIAPTQIYNVLDCSRTLFNWARRPEINMLPISTANPFTDELVGRRTGKDPLKPPTFPLERRIALVSEMDEWQLLHLCWRLVLPLRPEDFTGLLLNDIDTAQHRFIFGSRFGQGDFNKGHQEFSCPFPAKMSWLLSLCIGSRTAGPLLRQRQIYAGTLQPKRVVETWQDVESHVQLAIDSAPANEIQATQDRKRLIRHAIRDMGGVTEDYLRKELQSLFRRSGLTGTERAYDLRGSINSELEDAGVSHLVQRYVTGHTTKDVLNNYVRLLPTEQMQKYFDTLEPLFQAFQSRAEELSIL